MKIDQDAKGLDGDYHPGHGFISIKGLLEELFEGLIGAAAELSQQLSIESKMGPEHLGESKHVLPMGNWVEDLFSDPLPEHQHPFLVTGRAEVTALAGEGQQDLVSTALTLDSGKAFS